MHNMNRLAFGAALVLLAACGKAPQAGAPAGAGQEQAQAHKDEDKDKDADKDAHAGHDEHAEAGKAEQHEKAGADEVHLTPAQIAAARIDVSPVRASAADAIEAPATIEADPARSHIVAVAVGGRVAALQRNLGEAVRRGDILAIIESAQAAEMKAELESARRQAEVTRVALEREERLYGEKVSAEQELLAARAQAGDARTRLRLAQQRLAAIGATGADGGPLNRVVLRAPISGHVVARSATVGSVVPADTELYRIADLSQLAVKLALNPEDAGRVAVGQKVEVITAARSGSGKIAYVSPLIDPESRLVTALATLPNPGARWRVGETVRASVALNAARAQGALAVPRNAVQTVEDKPTVFVRTGEGFAARHVVLGPSNGSEVTVLSGLAPGDSVAVTNSYVLKAELAKGEGGAEHHH